MRDPPITRSRLAQDETIHSGIVAFAADGLCTVCQQQRDKYSWLTVPGCPYKDQLCFACYPWFLRAWAESSNEGVRPCPVCQKGAVKWSEAIARARHLEEFIEELNEIRNKQ